MASILIIDDEVAIATAFAMFFRHDGKHQVTEAHTGGEGIEAFGATAGGDDAPAGADETFRSGAAEAGGGAGDEDGFHIFSEW